MSIRIRTIAAGSAAFTLVFASALGLCVQSSSAATPQIPFTDKAAVGGVTLESASGAPITGGSLTDAPTFPIAVGNTPAGLSSDNAADLEVATPKAKVNAIDWVSEELQGQSGYTAGSVPRNVGDGTAITLGEYIVEKPGSENVATDSYAGLYELRLIPETKGNGFDANYFTAVISVTESGTTDSDSNGLASELGTWSLVSTVTNSTVTATSASMTSAGSTATLTSTTTPAAAGTVTFIDGGRTIGTATTDASTGVASTTSTVLAPGTSKILAYFVPTVPTSFDPSTAPAANYTSTAAVVPPASLPEAPYALLLPLLGGAIGGGYLLRRRAPQV